MCCTLIDAYTSKCGLIDSFKANGQSRVEAETGVAPARYTHQPRLLVEANRAQYLAARQPQPQPQSSPSSTQNAGGSRTSVTCGCGSTLASGGGARSGRDGGGGGEGEGEGDSEAGQERSRDSAAAVEAMDTAQEEQCGSGSRQGGLLGGRSPSLASTSSTSSSISMAKEATASGAAAAASSETASAGGRRSRGRQAQQAMQLVRAVVPQRKRHTLTDAVHLLSTKPFEQKLLMYVHIHKPGLYLSKCSSKNLPFDESRFQVPCFCFI